ncbi:MAG: flagellar type III secretion system pore protein FliP [Phyllobacteriaceae bacterium]|jgi:flagellar biosynthetic protein FliP|nr:flagellar type III secretion system pore protein FliP [Phyllobacteriaceae bacterium]
MTRITPFVLVLLAVMVPLPAAAQGLGGLGLPDGIGGLTSANIIQLFGLITVLAVAPGLLIMVTSFTRFIIVFSILRTGLGLQSTPANIILISLALFMTFYVMAPTFDRAWQNGLQPLLNNDIQEEQALSEIIAPFRDFMLENTRDEDLDLFTGLARERGQDVVVNGTIDMRILIPAFMISEIRRGFEIGFLVVLPFLVIDLIVATIIMAMGMMMLPPSVISLPFKILFFVMIDGWNLLVGSLVRSFV